VLSLKKRLFVTGLLLVIIVSVGTSGYLIMGWRMVDALYMTIISLTTVGYGEIQPLTTGGRIFTIFLILSGLGVLFYGISNITAFLVEGELTGILARRRMEKAISELKDHFLVCGLGKTGQHVVEELLKTESSFVAIEKEAEKIEEAQELGDILCVCGDATKNDTLLEANIEKARGLVTTLPTDSENLFVVLSAREMNPTLRIVSRVIEDDAEHKLYKVGANSVVSTDFIGGLRMASELIRPSVVSFLDLMLRDPGRTLRVSETRVPEGSKMSGTTIVDADFREKAGVLVLAIRRSGAEEFIYAPSAHEKIQDGDTLIVLGDINQMHMLDELLKA
jgi:voltage-gated potassium channel